MMLYMMITITMILLMFNLFLQPLYLGLIALSWAIMLSLILSILFSSWYSIILMLIYVGGMLVMFFYLITVSPNNMFKLMKKLDLTMITMLWLINMMIFSFKNMSLKYMTLSYLISEKMYIKTNFSILMAPNYFIYIILTSMLMISMMMVVKLCFKKSGALRSYEMYDKK